MRHTVITAVWLAALLAAAAPPAGATPVGAPRVAILSVGLAGHTLRITMATAGLEEDRAEHPVAGIAVWLDGMPIRAELPLIHMPPRFAIDLDLPHGAVRVGGVVVGHFAPVAPFKENLRFPVEVTVRRGRLAATAQYAAAILLPAVIVPGYLNEQGGPSLNVLAAFRRHGYSTSGPGQNVFWFRYPSRQVTLPDGARSLAAYVRRVVLPASYAASINVVGYSLGGLMARWDVAYDVDGWGALVNRLALVGVPNEGTVLAYLADHAPPLLPFAGLGRTPAAHAFMPTFPFWRASQGQEWGMPPDEGNALLAELNARPIPRTIRVYLFYGSHDPRDAAGPQTSAGITGTLPAAALSYGPGDGVVLAASAQGLPVRAGKGVPGLADRAVLRVDLGAVYHTRLLDAAADRIAAVLLDRFVDRVDAAAAH